MDGYEASEKIYERRARRRQYESTMKVVIVLMFCLVSNAALSNRAERFLKNAPFERETFGRATNRDEETEDDANANIKLILKQVEHALVFNKRCVQFLEESNLNLTTANCLTTIKNVDDDANILIELDEILKKIMELEEDVNEIFQMIELVRGITEKVHYYQTVYFLLQSAVLVNLLKIY